MSIISTYSLVGSGFHAWSFCCSMVSFYTYVVVASEAAAKKSMTVESGAAVRLCRPPRSACHPGERCSGPRSVTLDGTGTVTTRRPRPPPRRHPR
jgi:hypothetical protein